MHQQQEVLFDDDDDYDDDDDDDDESKMSYPRKLTVYGRNKGQHCDCT